MAKEKIYVGQGKKITFPDGGTLLKVVLDLTDLNEAAKKHGFESDRGQSAGHKKIKIELCRRREADTYGNTHYATVDTWKPENSSNKESDNDDDL